MLEPSLQHRWDQISSRFSPELSAPCPELTQSTPQTAAAARSPVPAAFQGVLALREPPRPGAVCRHEMPLSYSCAPSIFREAPIPLLQPGGNGMSGNTAEGRRNAAGMRLSPPRWAQGMPSFSLDAASTPALGFSPGSSSVVR